MKHKFILIGLTLVSGLVSVILLVGLVSHQAHAMAGDVNWKQVNADGFGDYFNKQIPSLAVFDDYMYAGTWNYDGISITTQIWRTSTGEDWNMVDERMVNGTADLITFDGSIYAGSWDGHVWSSPNGITWTEVISDGFDGSGQGIARFAVYSDTLYASTWANGTDIWQTNDGISWEPFVMDGLGDLNNSAAIASEIFNGNLYWGVSNGVTGAQLWRTDGITTTAIITGGFEISGNIAISALAQFQESLYAGVYNLNGVQVWRSTNGTEWEQVGDGFTHPGEATNALRVYNKQLYLVAENDASGLEVWRTSNGTDWEQVGFNGFGDPANTQSYWDNGTTVFKNKLYVAMENWPTGGEVWQMTPEYKTYLPCTVRACQLTYNDNFSNPASGWPVESDPDYSIDYWNGEYRITVNPGWIAWSTKDFGVSDYKAEVDARIMQGPTGGLALVFGATDDGFYVFEVSEGYFGLWRIESGPWTWTTLIDWTLSAAILPGYQTNHLKVERTGSNITMYANGQTLGSVSDGIYTGSGVGMASEAFSEYFDGRFDNFTLSSGSCLGTQAAMRSLNYGASFQILWTK